MGLNLHTEPVMRPSFAILLALLMAIGCDVDSGSTGPSVAADGGGGAPGTAGASGGDPGTAGGGAPGGGTPGGEVPAAGGCAPLPAPSGAIVRVTPDRANELPDLVANAASGTTLVLADGTYKMTSTGEAARRLQFRRPNVTLRSESNRRGAVILDGEYATQEMITIDASNVTIASLTITHAIDHPVHVTGGATNVTGVRLYDLHIVDGGEQQIKVNSGGSGASTTYVDDGKLECSRVELTEAGRGRVERLGGTSCYTGGIDAHQARGWLVRGNTFVGIYCAGGPLAEHAVHFWSGARDTIVEQNRILDCARGIGFGLVESGASRAYADNPYPGMYVGHYDDIIRNNFVYASIAEFDTGIELDQARGVRVLHNTLFHPSAAFSSIDARFSNTRVDYANNILVKTTTRNGAVVTAGPFLSNVSPALFVNAATGDLHLIPAATTAVAKGTPVSNAGLDIDGSPRDPAAPDLGAHELQ